MTTLKLNGKFQSFFSLEIFPNYIHRFYDTLILTKFSIVAVGASPYFESLLCNGTVNYFPHRDLMRSECQIINVVMYCWRMILPAVLFPC